MAAPTLVCNEERRFLVAEQLRHLGHAAVGILLEPAGPNRTLTLAALSLREHRGDVLMLVMPADHVIQDIAAFQATVHKRMRHAADGLLVTFGVVPTSPEAGYGYIRRD